MLVYIFIGLFYITSTSAVDIVDCFNRYGNCDIIQLEPFNRTWKVATESDCVRLCGGYWKGICWSLVYEVKQEICNMYDQDGDEEPAFLIPSYKKTYYKVASRECLASVVDSEEGDGTTKSETETSEPTTEIPTTTIPPDENECPSGEKYSFLEFEFVKLDIEEAEVFEEIDFADCLSLCAENIDPDGGELPCYGVVHVDDEDLELQECYVYSEKFKLDQLKEDKEEVAITYIKQCLPEEQVDECSFGADAVFPAFRGMSLKGALDTTTVTDLESGIQGLTECLSQCIDDQNCYSIEWKDSKHKCILQDVYRENVDEEDFVKTKAKDVYLIENTCAFDEFRSAVKASSRSARKLKKSNRSPDSQLLLPNIESPPPESKFGTFPAPLNFEPPLASDTNVDDSSSNVTNSGESSSNTGESSSNDTNSNNTANSGELSPISADIIGPNIFSPLSKTPSPTSHIRTILSKPGSAQKVPDLAALLASAPTLSLWSEWSDCQRFRGLLLRIRIRKCEHPLLNCPGEKVNFSQCP